MSRMRVFLLLTFAALSSGQLSWMSDKRIRGGYDTSIYRFPHQVAIVAFRPGYIWGETWGDWEFRCGGVLISDQYILTAGRCLFKSFWPGVKFRLPKDGLNDILPEDWVKVAVGQEWSEFFWKIFKSYFVAVEKVIPYPYICIQPGADIGLIKLKNKVELSATTKWVTLKKFPQKPKGLLEFSGWGSEYLRTAYKYQLQGAEMQIEDDNVCENKPDEFPNYDRDINICIRIKFGGWTITCARDEGGGYVIRKHPNFEGSYNLVAIHSMTSDMCLNFAKMVGVYVPAFHNWIRQMTGVIARD